MTEIAASKTSDCDDTEKAPTTEETRQRLRENMREVMSNERTKTIRSPTSSGKSHTAVTTSWKDYPEITGGEPVVYLSPTTDARDSSRAKNAKSDATSRTLLGREDACPVAGGDHDDMDAPDGGEPSEWFEKITEKRGLPISVAHGIFERHHDGDIPCTPCECSSQWEGLPRDSDGEPADDIIIATHQFARVPSLIEDLNIIIDEQPDFTVDKDVEDLVKAVRSYLNYVEAPVERWEDLISGYLRKFNHTFFRHKFPQPDSNWFIEGDDAHVLAPGIVDAILNAEERRHGRWVGETVYQYPDLNPHHDSPESKVRIRIVFDNENAINILQVAPDFSAARSVIGLDAHPTNPKWKANTLDNLSFGRILNEDEEQLWRKNERNLNIIQVGNNKNPWTNREYNQSKVTGLCSEIFHHYGNEFSSAITSKNCYRDLRIDMEQVGIDDPDTINYGKEKSVEKFAEESVGAVLGCISPSSESIKDWLALLDKVATPRREVDENYEGQQWVGPDHNIAHEILADVREKHVLQAVGRFARSPSDPDDEAVVYVYTNVLPDRWIDQRISDIDPLSDLQQEMVDLLYDTPNGLTPSRLSDETDATTRYVYRTLAKISEAPWGDKEKTEGANTGDKYHAERNPNWIVDIS